MPLIKRSRNLSGCAMVVPPRFQARYLPTGARATGDSSIIEVGPITFGYRSDSVMAGADFRARPLLASAVADIAGSCAVETQLAVGKPYREILRVAGEQQADLIIMGVRGRGPADLMFFGSTTSHVVRQAHCPVLTIRK